MLNLFQRRNADKRSISDVHGRYNGKSTKKILRVFVSLNTHSSVNSLLIKYICMMYDFMLNEFHIHFATDVTNEFLTGAS